MTSKKKNHTMQIERRIENMRMTEEEYEELIGRFVFLNDKVEECYKRETKELLERLKDEYKKYVVKY